MLIQTDFRLNALIHRKKRRGVRISPSRKDYIFASVARIGLFNTGGIAVELVSISKHGALLRTEHHLFIKSFGKNLTIELSVNGKYFEYQAIIIQQNAIDNLYGIKFSQYVEAIDEYLTELNIEPVASSVWLDFELV